MMVLLCVVWTVVSFLKLAGAVVVISQAVSRHRSIGESERERRCNSANAKQNGEH